MRTSSSLTHREVSALGLSSRMSRSMSARRSHRTSWNVSTDSTDAVSRKTRYSPAERVEEILGDRARVDPPVADERLTQLAGQPEVRNTSGTI